MADKGVTFEACRLSRLSNPWIRTASSQPFECAQLHPASSAVTVRKCCRTLPPRPLSRRQDKSRPHCHIGPRPHVCVNDVQILLQRSRPLEMASVSSSSSSSWHPLRSSSSSYTFPSPPLSPLPSLFAPFAVAESATAVAYHYGFSCCCFCSSC